MYTCWHLPDYEDRITLWPPGVLVSHPEPWSSGLQGSLLLFLFPNTEDRLRTEAGTGWRAGGCRTLGKRSEVMHFSIRFWLTFFFTKMDTQCSITSWISVPLKTGPRMAGITTPLFMWKRRSLWYKEEGLCEEAEPLKWGGGATGTLLKPQFGFGNIMA